jgi:hypothetical protein
MKVIDYIHSTPSATTMILDTGHIAVLNDDTDEMTIITRTGKPVQANSATWKNVERAVFETNPTRSKW